MAQEQGTASRNIHRARRLRKNLESPSSGGVTKVRWWFVGPIIWMYIFIQLPFAFISIIGLGGEKAGEGFLWGLGSYFLPGREIFAICWVVASSFALAAMVLALFSVRNSSIWKRGHIGTFLIFTTFSFTPFLNIFPWALIWIALRVLTAQNTQE